MNGSDDASNLVEVTVEEHADLHRQLWEDLGYEEDRIAWLALSGQIDIDDAARKAHILGSQKGGKKNKEIKKTLDHRKNIGISISQYYDKMPIAKINKSKFMIGNTNSKKHSSDEYRNKQSTAMKLAWKKRKGEVGERLIPEDC